MDELLPRLWLQAGARWNWRRKFIIAVVIAAVIGMGLVFSSVRSGAVSAGSAHFAPVFDGPINDQEQFNRLLDRLNREGEEYNLSTDSRVLVADVKSARRLLKAIFSEGSISQKADLSSVFQAGYIENSNHQQDIDFRHKLAQVLEKEIVVLDSILDTKVRIQLEGDGLLTDNLNINKVVAVATPAKEWELPQDRVNTTKTRDIIPLSGGNIAKGKIVITDHSRVGFNDVVDAENENHTVQRGNHEVVKNNFEQYYRKEIIDTLSKFLSANRVKILRLDVSLEKFPKGDNEKDVLSFKMDSNNVQYSDENMVGLPRISAVGGGEKIASRGIATFYDKSYEDSSKFTKYTESNLDIFDKALLWSVKHVIVNVAIDGIWNTLFEPNGQVKMNESSAVERRYSAAENDDIKMAGSLIKAIIEREEDDGTVIVEHLQFDRIRQFSEEDELMRREMELLRMLPLVATGIIGLLVAAVFSWRRRRLRVAQTVGTRLLRINAW